MNKVDVILHPVRIQIISLLVNRPMTPREMSAALPDVPQATLYRHVNALAEAGVLVVEAERPVRAVVEKVYGLNKEAVQISPDDFKNATPEDWQRYATVIGMQVLGSIQRYFGQEKFDLEADRVGISQVVLYLSDEETDQLSKDMMQVFAPLMGNRPAPGRRRRVLNMLFFPEDVPGDKAARDAQVDSNV